MKATTTTIEGEAQAPPYIERLCATLAARGFALHKPPAGPWLIERSGAAA
jgi:hypothetical protein